MGFSRGPYTQRSDDRPNNPDNQRWLGPNRDAVHGKPRPAGLSVDGDSIVGKRGVGQQHQLRCLFDQRFDHIQPVGDPINKRFALRRDRHFQPRADHCWSNVDAKSEPVREQLEPGQLQFHDYL